MMQLVCDASTSKCQLVFLSVFSAFIITDRVSTGGNAIVSVRPFVCPSIRLFPLYLRN